MTQMNEIYKCEICGNVVEVHQTGAGELVCCGEPMQKMEEKKEDQGQEKHVPVIEKDGEETIIKVGENPHPMEEDHYIEWIEVVKNDGKKAKAYLTPKDEPKMVIKCNIEEVKGARIYCNIHGLWTNM